jgi:hypothetical protein
LNIKKFSETIYFVEGDCFIKIERSAASLSKKIYRAAFGGALTFQNEIGFHLENAGRPGVGTIIEGLPTALLIPSFKESNEGDPALHSIKIAKQIKGIISNYVPYQGFGVCKRTVFRVLEAPIWRTCRESTRIAMPSILKLKLLYRLIILNFKISNLRVHCSKCLIHNDMAPNNLRLHRGKPVLIDFEDTILEKNWIFVDVTDLIFSYGGFSLQQGYEFLSDNSVGMGDNIDDREIRLHAEFGFIRSLVRRAVMSRNGQKDRLKYVQELSVYLSDNDVKK